MPPDPAFAEAARIARASGDYREEGTGYVDLPVPNVDTLRRYFSDPEFAGRLDAERADWQRRTHALIDAAMERARERRAVR